MPFPNLYRCNKVLVNQKKLVKHCLQRQVAFAAVALRAAALRKFIADYRLHVYCCLLLFIASMHCTLLVFIATYCYQVVQI